MLLAVVVGAVKEGSGFLPSRRVLGCAITGVPSRCVHQGVCYQGAPHQGGCGCGFFEAGQTRINPLLVEIQFMAVVVGSAATEAHGSGSVGASWAAQVWIHSARSDLGSLHALQVSQVWVRFVLCRQIRPRFAPCFAGRSGESVGRSGGSTMPESGQAHYRWSGYRHTAQTVVEPLRCFELWRS